MPLIVYTNSITNQTWSESEPPMGLKADIEQKPKYMKGGANMTKERKNVQMFVPRIYGLERRQTRIRFDWLYLKRQSGKYTNGLDLLSPSGLNYISFSKVITHKIGSYR
jgi:hypothetical protein